MDSEQETRHHMAGALRGLRGATDVPALIATLQDVGCDERPKVAYAVGKIQDAAAVPVLISALKDSEAYVRRRAIVALGEIGGEEAIVALTAALQDDDPGVRRRIYDALVATGDVRAIPALATAFRDRHNDVQAGTRLHQFGVAAIPALIEALQYADEDPHQFVSGTLDDMAKTADESIVPILMEALQHPNEVVRWVCAGCLGQIRDERASTALILDLQGSDAVPQWVAIRALGHLDTPEALSTLREALRASLLQRDLGGCCEVVEALEETSNPVAIPTLIEALQVGDEYPYFHLRPVVARALKKQGAVAIPELIAALRETNRGAQWMLAETLEEVARITPENRQTPADNTLDPRVRQTVLTALNELRDRETLPGLIEDLKDVHDGGRQRAIYALGKIGEAAAVPALLEVMQDKSSDVRMRVVRALGEIGDLSAIPALIAALQDIDPEVCYRAVQALGGMQDERIVPALIAALQNTDRYVSESAVEALGEIGDPAALPALLDILKDTEYGFWKPGGHIVARAMEKIGDAPLRAALLMDLEAADRDAFLCHRAALALAEIGAPEVIPALIESFRNDEEAGGGDGMCGAMEALARIGMVAVPALIEALQDIDLYVRWSAAATLEAIAKAPPLAHLMVDLNDADAEVRWSAACSLRWAEDASAALPVLIEALDSPDKYVRAGACRGLGRIGDPAAIPALSKRFRDADGFIYQPVDLALRKIRRSRSGAAGEEGVRTAADNPLRRT